MTLPIERIDLVVHRMNLLKNFLSLAGAEVISKIVTFAAFAYLARVAGPDVFGYLEFAGATLFCAWLLVEQGFGSYGAREIAKAPERTRDLVWEISLTRLIFAVIAYGAMIAFAFLSDHAAIVTKLLLIYGSSLIVGPFLLQWVFQGHDQMRVVAAAQVIKQTVFAGVVFGFAHDAALIWVAAVAEVAGAASAATYVVFKYKRRFGAGRLRLKITGRLFREGAVIGLSQMFWVARFFGATIILGVIAPAGDIGYFAGALRILVAIHAFVWLYCFNLLPSLSRLWREDHTGYVELVNRSMRVVSHLAIAMGLAWVALAPQAMTIFYGPAFAPGGEALQWMAGVFVVASLSCHYRYGLIAAGLQNVEAAASVCGAVVAAVAIPVGYTGFGLRGAAIGLLSAETSVWIITWGFGYRMLGLKGHSKLLLRPWIGLIIVSIFLWLTPLIPSMARAVVAAAAMIAMALAFDSEARRLAIPHISSLWRRFEPERG